MNNTGLSKGKISRAIAEYARSFIAVLDWPDGRGQFSGICLASAGQHFVITASHCLDDGNPADLVIATMKEECVARPLRPVKGRAFSSSQIDIAALLVDPLVAASLPVDWLGVDRLTSQVIAEGQIACVAGFPSALRQVQGDQHPQAYSTACVLMSLVAPWPKPEDLSPSDRPVRPEIEFFIEYTPDLFADDHDRIAWVPSFPGGMSGSPVFWVPSTLEDVQSLLGYIRLVGIQSSQMQTGILRVQRIEPVEMLIRSAITGGP